MYGCISVWVYKCMGMCVYVYVCMDVQNVCIEMCLFVCVCVQVRILMYRCTHINTLYECIHKHTGMHELVHHAT